MSASDPDGVGGDEPGGSVLVGLLFPGGVEEETGVRTSGGEFRLEDPATSRLQRYDPEITGRAALQLVWDPAR